ncbi:MAG: class I SAM-dependent methyltransferase [Candidatus Dormibacteraeota bacterium]|nr:class I SAM-dependent methyltransferase [Candidatus Dormibacteraeota bacterium]
MALDRDAAAEWLRRWDAQQQLHIPDREERFAAMVAALEAFAGHQPRVLDLGAGPGSLAARVLTRLPAAQVVAIDTDPVLLAIARSAHAGDSRLHVVDADLRADWRSQLPLEPPFDAAMSTTALHWLTLAEIVEFDSRLASVLRPGAVFFNGDRFDFGHDQRRIGEAVREVQRDWGPAPPGAEDWTAWWSAIEADASLVTEVAERRNRHHEHPHDDRGHTYEFHRQALLAAGFAEVATIWQHLMNRVLIAVR